MSDSHPSARCNEPGGLLPRRRHTSPPSPPAQSSALQIAGLIGAALLAGLVLTGCGGKKKSPAATVAAEAPPPPPAAPPVEEAVEPDPNEALAVEGAVEPVEEQPALPADVAAWKPADYATAKRIKDPQLDAAVARLVGAYPTSQKVAEVLVQLLVDELPGSAQETEGAEEEATTPDDVEAGGEATPEGEGDAVDEEDAATPDEGATEPVEGEGEVGGEEAGDPSLDESLVGAEPEFDPNAPPPEPIRVPAEVASRIVAALARNGTPPATAALRKILAGELSCPLEDSEAVKLTVQGMAASENPAYEAELLKALTQPEKIRAPVDPAAAAGGLGPEQLQQETLRVVGPLASVALRRKMAQFLDDPQVPIETAELFEAYLIQDKPHNLPAQLVLFRNEQTEPQTRLVLQTKFADESGAALSRLLRLDAKSPDAPATSTADRLRQRVGRPSRRDLTVGDEAEPDVPREPSIDEAAVRQQVVAALWSAQGARLVAAQLRDTPNLSEATPLVRLAGSTPLTPMRLTLRQVMLQRAAEGPQPFVAGGLMGTAVSDPGFLVLAKTAYHKKKARRPRTTRGDGEATEEADPQGQAWVEATRGFVDAWTERLRAAALRRGRPQTPVAAPEGEPVLPATRNTQILAELRIAWPADVPPEFAAIDVAPLRLRYVQATEEAGTDKMLTRFTRYARRGKVHDAGDRLWIDTFAPGEVAGTGQSIDILLRSHAGPIEPGSKAVQRFTVDFLVVEIPAPPAADAPGPADAGAGAAATNPTDEEKAADNSGAAKVPAGRRPAGGEEAPAPPTAGK